MQGIQLSEYLKYLVRRQTFIQFKSFTECFCNTQKTELGVQCTRALTIYVTDSITPKDLVDLTSDNVTAVA